MRAKINDQICKTVNRKKNKFALLFYVNNFYVIDNYVSSLLTTRYVVCTILTPEKLSLYVDIQTSLLPCQSTF